MCNSTFILIGTKRLQVAVHHHTQCMRGVQEVNILISIGKSMQESEGYIFGLKFDTNMTTWTHIGKSND